MVSTVVFAVILAQPVFGPREIIEYQGSPLDMGLGSAPCVVDWNGDGLQDLIMGTRTCFTPFSGPCGIVLYIPNTGTSVQPVFDSYVALEAGGVPIAHGT